MKPTGEGPFTRPFLFCWYNGCEVNVMDRNDVLASAFHTGRFFVSDIYAFYQDTYKGQMGKVQVEVLDYLCINEQASIMELAGRLNISKQHASVIAGKLEDMGYASKRRNPDDGRSWLYSLTAEGRSFVEAHIAQSNEYLFERLSRMDEGDRELLERAIVDAARALKHDADGEDPE